MSGVIKTNKVVESQNSINREGKIVKKRNRLSYVCQACRKAKTKCDKEKPECNRCYKLGLKCIYDIAMQHAPKNSSKETTILRLENELDYWKKKAKQLIQEQEALVKTKNKHFGFGTDNLLQWPIADETLRPTNTSKEGFLNYKVKLCESNPRLIISKVIKREINPLSENYIIINDMFLARMIVSTFASSSSSGNCLIPAITANVSISRSTESMQNSILKMKENMRKRTRNKFERLRIESFTNRILQIVHPSNKQKLQDLVDSLKQSKENQYLEDHCADGEEYSELLKDFIKSYEDSLPPMNIINRYKNHFYENIYTTLPFVDKELFEETLNATLFIHPDDETKVEIRLGTTGIRNRLEHISLLGVILKISYMALTFIADEPEEYQTYLEPNMLEKYPIHSDMISLSMKFLASVNWCACPNENIVANILYIWAYFVYSPNEGDFFLDAPTEIISDLTIIVSKSIGLHRDPSDYEQFDDYNDRRLINHRRLLWLSVISMSIFESSLKGRRVASEKLLDSFINIHDPNSFNIYMNRVKKDLTTNSRFLISLHELAYRRTYLALLYEDLNIKTVSYSDTYTLKRIEQSMQRIDAFIGDELHMSRFEVNVTTLEGSPEDVLNQMSILTTQTSLFFICQIMSTLCQLKTSNALMLHFENLCITNKTLLPYFYRYFGMSIVKAIRLCQMYEKYYTGNTLVKISKLTRFNIEKFLQMALTSTIFSLWVALMRLEQAERTIVTIQQEISEDTGLKQKILLLKQVRNCVEMGLNRVYSLASDRLRFTYFPVFKMLSLVDVFMKKLRSDNPWDNIFGSIDIKAIDPRVLKIMRMTFNIKIDKNGDLIDTLDARNHVAEIPLNELSKIYEEIVKLENLVNINNTATSNSPSSNVINGDRNTNKTNVSLEPKDANSLPVFFETVPNAESLLISGLNSREDKDELTQEKNDEIPNDISNILGNLEFFDYDIFFSND